MPAVVGLTVCAHFGIGVASYSPIARGGLTGKYLPGEPPPDDSRAGRKDRRIMQSEWRPESLHMAQEIAAHARARGMTPTQFAVQWVLNNRFISSAIAGPRTLGQIHEYLSAHEHAFEPQDEALIDQRVVPGHPSTPGYSGPAYPIEGRPAWTAD